jgi:HEAT repeat protein
MRDGVPEVRLIATQSIGALRGPAQQVIPSLTMALKDPSSPVRQAAASGLSKLGRDAKPATRALAMALEDKDAEVCLAAAQALSRIGPEAKAAIPALIRALSNQRDEYARSGVAQALGRIGPDAREAVPALVKALRDSDDGPCGWAAWALGQIGPSAREAVPELAKIVNQDLDAISALGMIGPDAKPAVPVLIKALKIQEPLIAPTRAAKALGGIGRGAREAVPALIAIVEDKEAEQSTREAAALAIAKIDPEYAAKHAVESAALTVRLRKLPAIKLAPRPTLSGERKKQIQLLIRKLAEVQSADFGISATLTTGHAFAPLPGQERGYGLLLTAHKIGHSDVLRRLVEIGPDALPFLLQSLEDSTPTRLKVSGAFMDLGSELTGNPLNAMEKQVLATPWHDQDEGTLPESYLVKVGDVSFVAIGQIVGRKYTAVGYQPSGCIAISGPVENDELREQVRAIWSSQDPVQKVFDSLMLDYATEGKFNGRSLDGWYDASPFQVEAAMRLLYYFPQETAPLIASQLRSLDVRNPGTEIDAGTKQEVKKADTYIKREVRNGVNTEDFINAVSWCQLPVIQRALADIAKRTDDPDIAKLLASPPAKQP